MSTTAEAGPRLTAQYHHKMKKRMLTGWTWMRGAFLFMGIWMIVQTTFEGQWLGIILGAWLAVMGLFGFGCAAGNCITGIWDVRPEENHER